MLHLCETIVSFHISMIVQIKNEWSDYVHENFYCTHYWNKITADFLDLFTLTFDTKNGKGDKN